MILIQRGIKLKNGNLHRQTVLIIHNETNVQL